MKRAKNRRKNNILFLLFTILLFLCVGIVILFFGKISNIPPINTAESQNEVIEDAIVEDSAQEIQGIIKDATMNTLTIYTEDGKEYSFGTEGVNISTGETGLQVGNQVSISYYGKLDQNVELLSITVKDTNLDVDDSEPVTVPSETVESSQASNTVSQTAEEILNKMTLDEKVGQMFIARCPETEAVQKAEQYHLGGYILFGKDFSGKTKNEVIEMIHSYQEAVKTPMFIGVDEEGGTVNRVSTNPNLRQVPFWSPQELYADGGLPLIQSDTEEKCELLHSLGINLNFAPVCDVSENSNDFIYNRSFGQDARQTASYVQTVVETMDEQEMGSVLKHFPGYGNNTDTHTGMANDNRSYEIFLNSDFLPFQAGIDAGADMVLVSHNVVACMDDQYPASLSSQVHNILREKLGFTGVVITDDLAMDGVREFAGDTEIAVLAVEAGNDMLCCTDFEVQIPAVIEAVNKGRITEQRIDESVLRILELKISLGII